MSFGLRVTRWSGLATAALLAAAAAAAAPAQAQQVAALFGTSERRSVDLSQFPKWRGVLQRYERERHLEDRACGGGACGLQKWRAFLAGLKGRDRLAQLHAVNAYWNRVAYRTDREIYGANDYWATPREMLERAAGDCEDYAFAKYVSLRRLGFTPGQLRLAIVQDERQKILHAVLIVYIQGTAYVLDNQIKAVTEHRHIGHYRPIYSINEMAWWFHGSQAQVLSQLAPRPAPASRPRRAADDRRTSVAALFSEAGRR
jgi:predicted transglutaminase-like cysteine proteinase